MSLMYTEQRYFPFPFTLIFSYCQLLGSYCLEPGFGKEYETDGLRRWIDFWISGPFLGGFSRRTRLGRSRCGCWLGLRSRRWILRILLVLEHFLQWLKKLENNPLTLQGRLTFECLLYVDSFLCRRLKVRDSSFWLAEGHGTLWGYLPSRLAIKFAVVMNDDIPLSCSLPHQSCSPTRPIDISLSRIYTLTTTYKWEVIWISWWGLDQELIPPTIKCIETLGIVYVVD
jgi:hypothetical protein